MTQPHLILHKVRGEPAFDIAIQIECAICHGVGCAGLHPEDHYEGPPCDECDSTGYWWIIPTSGHRAYPYHSWSLDDLYDGSDMDMPQPMRVMESNDPPVDCPDHYNVRAEAITKLTGLLDKLGLKKSRPPLTLRPL